MRKIPKKKKRKKRKTLTTETEKKKTLTGYLKTVSASATLLVSLRWSVVCSLSGMSRQVGFISPGLTRVRDRPGKTQQTGIFCGKSFIAYIFRSQSAREQESKSARVQECKRAREQEQEQESKSKKKNKNKKARERTRTRKQEKEWQNPVPFKEDYPPPRTYYSLIG
jgi:type VI protein secretion system component VasK